MLYFCWFLYSVGISKLVEVGKREFWSLNSEVVLFCVILMEQNLRIFKQNFQDLLSLGTCLNFWLHHGLHLKGVLKMTFFIFSFELEGCVIIMFLCFHHGFFILFIFIFWDLHKYCFLSSHFLCPFQLMPLFVLLFFNKFWVWNKQSPCGLMVLYCRVS